MELLLLLSALLSGLTGAMSGERNIERRQQVEQAAAVAAVAETVVLQRVAAVRNIESVLPAVTRNAPCKAPRARDVAPPRDVLAMNGRRLE